MQRISGNLVITENNAGETFDCTNDGDLLILWTNSNNAVHIGNFYNGGLPSAVFDDTSTRIFNDTRFLTDVAVDRNGYLAGSLDVGGPLHASNDVIFSKDATVAGSLEIGGPLHVSNDVMFSKGAAVAGSLDVGGPLHASNDVMFSKGAAVAGSMDVGGTLHASNDVIFSKGAAVAGSLDVGGALHASNDAFVYGALDINGPLHASNDAIFSKDATVAGSLDVGGPVHASNDARFLADFAVYRNGYVAGSLDVGGTLRASNDARFLSDVAVDRNSYVAGSLRMGASGGVVLTHDGGSNLGVNLPEGVTPAYTLHVNGAIFATEQLYALSDMRLKMHIRRIRAPLDIVQSIRGYTYKMRDRPDRDCVGVLAQEVVAVLPEAVSTVRGGAMLSVSYDGLVGVLFEAVADLAAQVRELAKVAKGEGSLH